MKLNIRNLAELFAAVSVVASLLIVGYELRLSRSIAVTEGIAEHGDLNRSFRELVIENAEVWGRGCNGDELTFSEKIIFNNIVQTRINLGYVTWVRSGAGVMVTSPGRSSMRVALNRYRYPGFNTAYLQSIEANRSPIGNEGTNAWFEENNNQYQLLVDSDIPRNEHEGWCGR